MVLKPTADDTGSLILGAVALLGAIALGARAIRRPAESPAAAAVE